VNLRNQSATGFSDKKLESGIETVVRAYTYVCVYCVFTLLMYL